MTSFNFNCQPGSTCFDSAPQGFAFPLCQGYLQQGGSDLMTSLSLVGFKGAIVEKLLSSIN